MHASCRHRRCGRLPSRAGDGAGSGSPSGDEVITPRRFSSAAKPVMKPVMKPVTPRCKLLENVEYVRTRGGVSGSQRDYLSALFDSVTFALYGALQIGSVAYFRHDRQARCVSSGNLLQRNSIAPLALGRGRFFSASWPALFWRRRPPATTCARHLRGTCGFQDGYWRQVIRARFVRTLACKIHSLAQNL
jgi:hypothetical protein